jgi:hypothetical protein
MCEQLSEDVTAEDAEGAEACWLAAGWLERQRLNPARFPQRRQLPGCASSSEDVTAEDAEGAEAEVVSYGVATNERTG